MKPAAGKWPSQLAATVFGFSVLALLNWDPGEWILSTKHPKPQTVNPATVLIRELRSKSSVSTSLVEAVKGIVYRG